MGLDLTNKVAGFLQQNPDRKFTARDIANWIFETYPDECRQKQQRSRAKVSPIDDDAALVQQITSEIGSRRIEAQRKHPNIKATEGRPRKFYFTELTDSEEIDRAAISITYDERTGEAISTAYPDSPINGPGVKEHDLYPILSDFLWSELGIYSKRIDEKRSRNARGAGNNRWLYPDLVGMEDLSRDWHREVKDCVQQYADKKTTLWSFEVKTLVNRSNIREVFFQTVSNSSWANFGYLVASEIEGADTLKELRILASLHGIGFIRLDAGNPSESQIMIPARERNDVDWNTANRLTEENKDFLKYIKLVRQFYQTGEVPQSGWDPRMDGD